MMEFDGLRVCKGIFETSGNLPCMTSFFRLSLTKNELMMKKTRWWSTLMHFELGKWRHQGITTPRGWNFFGCEATGPCCRRKMWPASSPAAQFSRFFNKVVSNEFGKSYSWWFQIYFFIFTPNLGEMIQLDSDEHIFQRIYKGYPPGNDHISLEHHRLKNCL